MTSPNLISQVSYTHFVHPAEIDIYVSASYLTNEGNDRFELFLTERMYNKLRGVNQGYSQPKNPIFVDCGTNIGIPNASVVTLVSRLTRSCSVSASRDTLDVLCCNWGAHALV